MMNDLDKAIAHLTENGCTCVLCLDNHTIDSYLRGVAPLLQLLDSRHDLTGYCAADKVVGKATAMLYRLLGVRAVWGAVMSKSAAQALQAGGVETHWEQLVDHIVNRTGTGPCPMEAATIHIDDPQEALTAIRDTLKKLRS